MKKFLFIFTFISMHIFATEKTLYICAIFQNEARFLDEWVQFHLDQGADRIYLYNNHSEDDYMRVLYKYIRAGVVSLRQWPYANDNSHTWNETQCKAYLDCIKRVNGKVTWVAFLDTDEFLFSPTGERLVDILRREYADCDAIGVNWVMYGSSGIKRLKKGEKLTDHMLYRAELVDPHVKTIVRPQMVIDCVNPHYFLLEKEAVAVNENKERFFGPFYPNSVKKLRINHYWSRDLDFLLGEKTERRIRWGLPQETLIEWESGMNAVYDPILSSVRD